MVSEDSVCRNLRPGEVGLLGDIPGRHHLVEDVGAPGDVCRCSSSARLLQLRLVLLCLRQIQIIGLV